MDSLFMKKTECLCEVIADLVAKDGFSFNQIAKSELTKKAFRFALDVVEIYHLGKYAYFLANSQIEIVQVSNPLHCASK